MVKEYYRLAKPGIVYGNLLTTLAAYLFASRWQLVTSAIWINFLATMFGLGFVIASACVFNNYIDRDIDQKMARTQDRALVSGAISNTMALLYGAILALIGFALLVCFVNILTTIIALIGIIVYVFAYTFSKRKTEWATEIGSIAGAVPIVVGYTAYTNNFDWTAVILFLILALWQMPHFYSIALHRFDEYAAAGIPVLPLKRGTWETKVRILLYIFAFGVAGFALAYFGYAGFAYLVVVEIAAIVWFWLGTGGFSAEDGVQWARKLFFSSLFVLVIFCVMLSVATLLP